MTWTWNPFWRWPGRLLALSLILGGVLVSWVPKPGLDLDLRKLLESDLHSRENYERVQALLPDEVTVVVSLECDSVFSLGGINTIERLSRALSAQSGCLGVKSLTHSVRPVRRGFGFEMVPLVSLRPDEAELRALRDYALAHPLVRNVMVSPDGRHTLLVGSYAKDAVEMSGGRREFCQALDQVLGSFRAEGYSLTVLSLPTIEEDLLGMVWRDFLWVVPAALVFALLMLWLHFRSLGVLVLAVGSAGVPVVLLPVLSAIVGLEWDPYVLLLFPLLVAVHLALQAHCYDAWQRAGLGIRPTREVVAEGLGEVFRPALFALLTTGIGLLSLSASSVASIRGFGQLGALGVALVFGVTFGPGLAAVLILPRSWLRRKRPSWFQMEILAPRQWGGGSSRWLGMGVGLVGVGLVAVIGWGWARMTTDVRVLEFLGTNSATRRAVEEIDQYYGGVNILTIEVDSGTEGGVNHLGFLKYLEQVTQYALAQPEVTAVYSYDQVLAMANEIWAGGEPGALKLPEDPRLVAVFAMTLRGFDLPMLAAVADPSFRRANWVMRTRDLPAATYLDLVERVLAYADSNKPAAVTLSSARGVHAILEADRRILRSQLTSAGWTLGLIGLVLLILWRSWRLALLALAGTALPVAMVLSLLGFWGIPLNSITVMVGAVCMGIAVDHAVHFLTHWRDGMRAGRSREEALRHSWEAKSRPIGVSTLVLCGVFGLFVTSSFPPVAHFGSLAAAAFLLACVSVLWGLPMVMSRGFWGGKRGECLEGKSSSPVRGSRADVEGVVTSRDQERAE